jgi:RNA 3'-terminal phosphate cyclase (ATP)
LVIDGARGEGGGQILRTALSLSAITGRAVRLENIRANRPKPGLAAQHLTAVRAVAAVCGARLAGDELGSVALDFAPGGPVRSGVYHFDVAAARAGGSAGSTTLVLQSLLPPLALCTGGSRVSIRGGTHMAWSPPFDYLRDVWLPALANLGIKAAAELRAWGWFPVGRGEIRAEISGLGSDGRAGLRPVSLLDRGPLRRVFGRAVAANLPEHIARRMAERAGGLLSDHGIEGRVGAENVRAACAGAGIFLTAAYENLRCGFSALGRRGKPAEQVAEEAVDQLLVQHASGAALDLHLADQILLPLAFAAGPSRFSTERITGHLETNARVVERFGVARVDIEKGEGGTGKVTVIPQDAPRTGAPLSRA